MIKTSLVLAPHTDDGELGCGGTIVKLIEQGTIVYYLAFSICEYTVPEEFPSDILATEVKDATKVLGIDPENLLIGDWQVRHFPRDRQSILEYLLILQSKLMPDLVFLPSTEDIHQDHQVIAQEGIRAFKHTTILGYELPWNNLKFDPTVFIELTPRHLETKVRAVEQYKSQAKRSYTQRTFLQGLAAVRGQQMGVYLAEAFQAIRVIVE